MLTIESLIAVLGFGLTCFSIGYAFRHSKNDRPPARIAVIFVLTK